MNYRSLGNSSVRVSVIGMGCWGICGSPMWGARVESESIRTIHAALDSGINLFDTAEKYGDGESERIVGKALKGRRNDAVVATKVSQTRLASEQISEACEESLTRLNTDYIDLYQIHWPSTEGVPLAETLEALETLKNQGKIRLFGVCNFGALDLTDLERHGHCDTNQLPYSLLWRAVEYDILPKARTLGYGVLAYSALTHGLLSGKYSSVDDVPAGRVVSRHFNRHREGVSHGLEGHEQLTFDTIAGIRRIAEQASLSMPVAAYGWVLQQQGITAVLAGATHPDQARRNAARNDE